MKILFLLDITNDKSEITIPNGRALEVLPYQLQLRQTGPGETWLAFPVDERGYNPQSDSHVPLVKFPVALKPPNTGSLDQQTPAEKPSSARHAAPGPGRGVGLRDRSATTHSR
jgi:hypothetical protein